MSSALASCLDASFMTFDEKGGQWKLSAPEDPIPKGSLDFTSATC